VEFFYCPNCGTKNVYQKWKPLGETALLCRYRFHDSRRSPCGWWAFVDPEWNDKEGWGKLKEIAKINPGTIEYGGPNDRQV